MVQVVKVFIIVGTIVPALAAPVNLQRPILEAREPEPVISPSALIKAGKIGYKIFSGVSLATSFAPLFHHHHKNKSKNKNHKREFVEDVELEIREPLWFPNMAEIKAFGKFLKMAGKKGKSGVEFGATVAPFIPHLGKKKKQANHRRDLEDLERREPVGKPLRLPHIKLPHFKMPHFHIPHIKLPHISRGHLAKFGGGAAAVAGFGGIIAASQLQSRELVDAQYEFAREDDAYDLYSREYDDKDFYAREDEEDMYSREYDEAAVKAREWEFDIDLREIPGFDDLD